MRRSSARGAYRSPTLFLSGARAALGAVILVLAFVAWSYPETTPWLLAVAGTIAVYALSVGIVDAFQGAVTAVTTTCDAR